MGVPALCQFFSSSGSYLILIFNKVGIWVLQDGLTGYVLIQGPVDSVPFLSISLMTLPRGRTLCGCDLPAFTDGEAVSHLVSAAPLKMMGCVDTKWILQNTKRSCELCTVLVLATLLTDCKDTNTWHSLCLWRVYELTAASTQWTNGIYKPFLVCFVFLNTRMSH